MSDFNPTRDEMMSALFAHMVMQQTNMAMMLLGKVAHPETGKTISFSAPLPDDFQQAIKLIRLNA